MKYVDVLQNAIKAVRLFCRIRQNESHATQRACEPEFLNKCKDAKYKG